MLMSFGRKSFIPVRRIFVRISWVWSALSFLESFLVRLMRFLCHFKCDTLLCSSFLSSITRSATAPNWGAILKVASYSGIVKFVEVLKASYSGSLNRTSLTLLIDSGVSTFSVEMLSSFVTLSLMIGVGLWGTAYLKYSLGIESLMSGWGTATRSNL